MGHWDQTGLGMKMMGSGEAVHPPLLALGVIKTSALHPNESKVTSSPLR